MRLFLLLLTSLWTTVAMALPQNDALIDSLPPACCEPTANELYIEKKCYEPESHAFDHLDLSLTTGSTGIGFDVSMPINDMFSLRAGYAIMPHFSRRLHFGVDVGDNPEESQSKFDRLSGLLTSLTGNQVDNQVDMVTTPTYWNWKLLLDVKPLKNKHWHFTAGIYAGNRQIGKAVNAIEDMSSLLAVSMYNNLYNKAVNNEPLVNFNGTDIYINDPSGNLDLRQKLMDYGMMGINMGEYKNDVLYEEDVVATYDFFDYENDIFYAEGDVIHHAGDVKIAKGSHYRMVPDENSMVKAWAYVNKFKPYIGFGYGGKLLKRDDSWQVSFDCGAMFWGGTPKVVTHDGTDLVNDVTNVPGKVGDYINLIKGFKVLPVLNLRITKRIF